ncbi:hypothetical protein DV735_g236, partial [Chaetothyriales sp. CBS 134920]
MDFPPVPPQVPEAVYAKRGRGLSSREKYNLEASYMSSVYDDSPPRTANTDVDSISIFLGPDRTDSPHTAYPSSRLLPQHEFHSRPSTRSAGAGTNSTPHTQAADLPPSRRGAEPASPASSSTTAMKALSDAIAAGFRSSSRMQTSAVARPDASPMRMPFQSSSPHASSDEREQEEEIAPPDLMDAPVDSASLSPQSMASTNALLGLGINKPGMSSKVPITRRPPRLNIDAVRDMEARGSTTSLTDLIKRATRLAANLDRGRTASKFDVFGSRERVGPYPSSRHHSSLSDMLSSFPAPATGGTPRRDTLWPQGEKGERLGSGASRGPPRAKRRCCGMSVSTAILVFVALILVITAAVLIPIFVVVIPKQHKTSAITLDQCALSDACMNGGSSTVVDGKCQCVCSNGFSGQNCSQSAGTVDCTSATVKDGSTTYTNATMGTLVQPLFSQAQDRFNISLNASIILSAFSTNNLSCSAENTLVDFNATLTTSNTRRFIIVPGHIGADEQQARPVVSISSTGLTPEPTSGAGVERRAESIIDSSNGIVFQTSAAQESTATAPSATITTGTATASQTTASSATSSATALASEEEETFAQVVVLYALQQSYTVALAANAQQSMRLFFLSASTGNGTVRVGTDSLPLTVDMNKFTITNADGSVVGGNGST